MLPEIEPPKFQPLSGRQHAEVVLTLAAPAPQTAARVSSSSEIKQDAARGCAAVALLPSKETLTGAYLDPRGRID